MVSGPLIVQKPRTEENEITKAFNVLKQVGSGNNTNTHHIKQVYDGYSGYGNDFTVPQKSYDIPMEKSWKYADVFTAVPHQNNFMDTNISAYPVTNENVIPTTNFVPQKDATHYPANVYDKNPFTFDNTIPGKLDFDLSALLAGPFMKQEAASHDYTIPSQPLDFNFTPQLGSQEENIPDNSVGAWGENVNNDTSSQMFENAGQHVDPFVNDFIASEKPALYPAVSTDNLLTDGNDQGSPLSSATAVSPLSSATVGSPMNEGMPWQDSNLEQFLGAATMDLSDMDIFLPPPPKRMHDSPEPVMMSPQYPTSPPEPLQEAPSPAYSEEDYVKPKPKAHLHSPTEKTRSKSAILFGKHEDEILHKLLIPNLSTPSKPITRDKLVSMPVEEFNHLLELAQLNDIEVAFMKEWRRRGKNKTAAQIARKRKREEVGDLEEEVEAMRQQRVELQMRYDQLRSQIKSLKERSLAAESRVYRQYSRSSGQSVSRDTHLIHVAGGNRLLLVPKVNSQIISVN